MRQMTNESVEHTTVTRPWLTRHSWAAVNRLCSCRKFMRLVNPIYCKFVFKKKKKRRRERNGAGKKKKKKKKSLSSSLVSSLCTSPGCVCAVAWPQFRSANQIRCCGWGHRLVARFSLTGSVGQKWGCESSDRTFPKWWNLSRWYRKDWIQIFHR